LYSTNISFEAILTSFYYKFFYGIYKSTNPDPNRKIMALQEKCLSFSINFKNVSNKSCDI